MVGELSEAKGLEKFRGDRVVTLWSKYCPRWGLVGDGIASGNVNLDMSSELSSNEDAASYTRSRQGSRAIVSSPPW